MQRPQISVTIITLNEEENITRAVESAKWSDEVLVVDSGSTDRTRELATKAGARVLTNAWRGYGQQKNFAQAHATHDWVFNLDADEVITPSLAQEIRQTVEKAESGNLPMRAFMLPRRTYYLGRWIRFGGWYPNHIARLADRRVAQWSEPSVHEELRPKNPSEHPTGTLTQPIEHFAFNSIEDQVLTNLRYSRLGSQDLLSRGVRPSLFRMIFKPVGKFLETYVLKRGFLDGISGLIISANAAHSVFLKYAYLFEPRLRGEGLASRKNWE